MSQPDTAALLRAISHETRLKIIGLLALEPQSQIALADRLKTQPEKLSRHLQLLAHAGLVSAPEPGVSNSWRLNMAWLQPDGPVVALVKREPAAESLIGVDPGDVKPLSAFVRDGRLVRIPVVASKQLVVMRWLVERFERNATYPESDVNEILEQVHPDFAALRRMLVDHRFMGRQNGIYRRIK
jgi:DNA-binding transcriptional ArsR family regulator